MNFLMPYLNWIKAAIVIALLAGLATLIWRAGANSVQVDWNKDKADLANSCASSRKSNARLVLRALN